MGRIPRLVLAVTGFEQFARELVNEMAPMGSHEPARRRKLAVFCHVDDLWRDQQRALQLDGLPKKKAEVFALMIDSILALMRENKEVLWGSMIKETMKRKKPSFNEGYYGYSTFSELLEDAERSGIIKLRKDRRSGTYVVEGWAGRR